MQFCIAEEKLLYCCVMPIKMNGEKQTCPCSDGRITEILYFTCDIVSCSLYTHVVQNALKGLSFSFHTLLDID